MNAGALDTPITIQSQTSTADATSGRPVITWASVSGANPIWAEWRDALPSRSESVREGLQVARNQTRVRIRYRDGIDSSMRVVRDGVVYNIVGGPAMLGRRDGLELVVERYSTDAA